MTTTPRPITMTGLFKSFVLAPIIVMTIIMFVLPRKAAVELAHDTSYGIGLALGTAWRYGWPVLAGAALITVLTALWVKLAPSADMVDWPAVEALADHQDNHDTAHSLLNGDLLDQERILAMERDLLPPRTVDDWIKEAEAVAINEALRVTP